MKGAMMSSFIAEFLTGSLRGARIQKQLLCPAALILLVTFTPSITYAGTIVSGDAAGSWDLSGSPYWVEGDLLVPQGSSLTIDPGVEVRFRGSYRMLVNGALFANGTESDSILFTRDNPVPGEKWRGLRFVESDSTSLLDYCRIEYVLSSTVYPEVRGGGVYCKLCSLTIRHCLIQENETHNENWNGTGGGIASVNAWPLIENCTIRNNYADSGGGIALLEDNSSISGVPVIRLNRITGNTAPYCGGGIYVGAFSTPRIENNIITGNMAGGFGGGGIALWTSNTLHIRTVDNNILSGNHSSTDGGGFYIRYDYSSLRNNTVVNNSAGETGGGVYVLNFGGDDFPALSSAIVWGITAPSGGNIHIYTDTTAFEVSYSDIEGSWPGTGNIDEDPQFADTDFHLQETSLCIDSGDPDSVRDDLCFPPSQGSARNDMGAYGGPLACQWPVQDPAAVDTGRGITGNHLVLHNTPNPFKQGTTIKFDLPGDGEASVEIFDLRGRMVRRLMDGKRLPAGSHRLQWDGMAGNGAPVPSGIYFCRIDAGNDRGERRMILLR